MSFKLPPFKTIVLAFIAGFFGIQICSLILSSLIPSLEIFKGGPIVLIFILGIAIMSLFILGIKFDEFKKDNLIFLLLNFGLLIAAYYFLPKYLPQIFSISPEVSNTIQSTMGAILG